MGQIQSSSDSSISYSNSVTEASAPFASPAGRVPPLATVMPLQSSRTFSSAPSVQPTAQWSEGALHQWSEQQAAPLTAESSIDSRRPSAPLSAYTPVTIHWFYCRSIELRQIWQPFSVLDSTNLELAYQSMISGKSNS